MAGTSVPGSGPASATATAAAAVAESSLGPRCKKRETRRAAFTLLAALCEGEEGHLRQTLVLLGGRDLVAKGFLDSDDSEHRSVGNGDGDGTQGDKKAEDVEEVVGVGSGEPWDYDPTSVLKESGQHVGLQNQVW